MITQRGRNFTKEKLSDTVTRVTAAPGLNYVTPAGEWAETDFAWEPCPHPSANWQVVKADFNAYALSQLGMPQQVVFGNKGHTVGLQAAGIHYRNKSDSVREMMPLIVSSAIVEGTQLRWAGAYGAGTELVWDVTPDGLIKWVTIDSAARLPKSPGGYGVGTTLEVPFVFVTSLGLDTKSSGLIKWDGVSTTEAESIVFGTDLIDAMAFQRPFYLDANGDQFWGRYLMKKMTYGTIISAGFDLAQLRAAVYPITLDPTITGSVDATANHASIVESTGGFTAATSPYVGSISTTKDYQGVWRFESIMIPKGATIVSANMRLFITVERSPTLRPTAQVAFDAADNPLIIASYADHTSRVYNFAANTWPITELLNTHTTSPSLVDITQAKVNQAGWVEGNAISVWLRQADRVNFPDNRLRFAFAGATVENRPKLIIEYSTAPPPVPAAPAPTATASTGQVEISWADVADATGYRAHRYETGQPKVLVYDGATSNHIDTTVAAGTSYHYGVTAYNGSGESAEGLTGTVTTPAADTTPPTLLVNVRGR